MVRGEAAKQAHNTTRTFYDDVMGFYHAVNWQEPLIITIACCHVVLFLCILITRKRFTWQTFFLVFIFGVIKLTETVNSYAARNWASVATQNYFDKQGVFMSTVVSLPLLLMSTFMVL